MTVLALVVALALPGTAVAGPAVTARAAVVMDATTGDVIWEDDGFVPLPPASTTKLMTAIVAIESGQLDESLVVSPYAAGTAPSRINLRAGQRMRLRNLLYALLLKSANDAGTVIAEGIGGSEAAFAGRMTARAEELGARTAHFKNAHGLSAPGHVASARDLAVIMRHALRLSLMREILSTRQVRVPVEAKRPYWISLSSHNRLLTGHTYRVIGKTGYTRAAGRCFVGAARSGEREIIIALLGSRDMWGDAKRLLAYGFGAGDEPTPVPVLLTAATPPTATAAPDRSAEGDEEEPVVEPPIGRFVVRLGPYKSQTVAKTTRTRLAKRGYSARVSGRTITIGSFTNQARAEHLVKRLKTHGYRGTVIAID
jgi:D-alanyl-D-alanine carboxypeptidase (penicillin-binding protein 5/6)